MAPDRSQPRWQSERQPFWDPYARRRQYRPAGGPAICDLYKKIRVERRAMGTGLHAVQAPGRADEIVLSTLFQYFYNAKP